MLWIEKYRPQDFSEITGQDAVVTCLAALASSGRVPHLLLSGPPGTGKGSAVECLARALFGPEYAGNTTFLQAADLFSLGRTALEQDPRYVHIVRRDQSLLSNIKAIIRWYAGMRPLGAPFRLLVFLDADALSRDAQQALRRTMERYSATSRFVLTTTRPSALIPAITSRCLPLHFRPVAEEKTLVLLRDIAVREAAQTGVLCATEVCELIAQASAGDVRRAVLLLQAALSAGGSADLSQAARTEADGITEAAFARIRSGDTTGAVRLLESLMIDYGLLAEEVLQALHAVFTREWNDPRAICCLADADSRLVHAGNDYIQLNALAYGLADAVSQDTGGREDEGRR